MSIINKVVYGLRKIYWTTKAVLSGETVKELKILSIKRDNDKVSILSSDSEEKVFNFYVSLGVYYKLKLKEGDEFLYRTSASTLATSFTFLRWSELLCVYDAGFSDFDTLDGCPINNPVLKFQKSVDILPETPYVVTDSAPGHDGLSFSLSTLDELSLTPGTNFGRYMLFRSSNCSAYVCYPVGEDDATC